MEEMNWARLLGGIGSGLRVSLADVHTMEDRGGAVSTTSGDIHVRSSEDMSDSRQEERGAGGRKRECFGPPAPAAEEWRGTARRLGVGPAALGACAAGPVAARLEGGGAGRSLINR